MPALAPATSGNPFENIEMEYSANYSTKDSRQVLLRQAQIQKAIATAEQPVKQSDWLNDLRQNIAVANSKNKVVESV